MSITKKRIQKIEDLINPKEIKRKFGGVGLNGKYTINGIKYDSWDEFVSKNNISDEDDILVIDLGQVPTPFT